MKKIQKLTLSKKSLEEIKGGSYVQNEKNEQVLIFSDSGCSCSCAGCSWEDGGSGFSIGMMYNKL